MTFMCKRCQEMIDGHEKFKQPHLEKEVLYLGDNMYSEFPKCAFDEGGNFLKDNWSCMTMIGLRNISSYHGWDDDESLDVIPTGDGEFIVLTYYKHRGCTGNAIVVCDSQDPRTLTLKEAENVLGMFKIRGGKA